jgi:hypothetical protein
MDARCHFEASALSRAQLNPDPRRTCATASPRNSGKDLARYIHPFAPFLCPLYVLADPSTEAYLQCIYIKGKICVYASRNGGTPWP